MLLGTIPTQEDEAELRESLTLREGAVEEQFDNMVDKKDPAGAIKGRRYMVRLLLVSLVHSQSNPIQSMSCCMHSLFTHQRTQ